MKTTTFVGLLLVLLSQSGFAQTPGEGSETHGGDPDRDYVMRVWRQTVVHVEAHREEFPELDAIVLSHEIDQPGHRPRITGRRQNCDGITNALACFNARTEIVTVSRPRLHDVDVSEADRFRILAHEAFRLLAQDDDYLLSQRLMRLVGSADFMNPPAGTTAANAAVGTSPNVDGCFRDLPQPNRTVRAEYRGSSACGAGIRDCFRMNWEDADSEAFREAESIAMRAGGRECLRLGSTRESFRINRDEHGLRSLARVQCLVEVQVPPVREFFACPSAPNRVSLPPSPEGWRQLQSFWVPRDDSSTVATATWEGVRELNSLGMNFVPRRSQGFLHASDGAGRVPLFTYYHSARRDTAVIASRDSIRTFEAAGYRLVRVEGYLSEAPREGYIPLRLFWNPRHAHHISSTRWSVEEARAAGYEFQRVEGYIRAAGG